MNSIEDLLLLEQKAQAVAQEGQDYYDKVMAQIQMEKKRLETQEKAHAEARIQLVQDTEKAAAQEQIEAIQRRYQTLIRRLEQDFADRQKSWEDTLFSLCIGGEDSGF